MCLSCLIMNNTLRKIILENPHCLVAFRHGETQWNVEDRLTTSSDIELTEKGIRQAQPLANTLSGISFTNISTSPLVRSRKTAEIACRDFAGSRITVDPRLAEPAVTVFEGKTFTELENGEHSLAFAKYQDEINPVFPDGTETTDETVKKAEELLDEVYKTPGRHLMFSHGAFLRVLTMVALGGSPNCYRRLKLGNCHGFVMKFYPEPPHQLLAWNVPL